MPSRRQIEAFCVLAVLALLATAAWASEPSGPTLPKSTPALVPPEPATGETLPADNELAALAREKMEAAGPVPLAQAPEWFQHMIQRIVRENVPDKVVVEKDWGKTEPRFSGIKWRLDGLRLSTKRRFREMNHGTWKRYEVHQIDPRENLSFRIERLHDAGGGKLGFTIRLATRMRVHGRLAKWTRGVQLYSVSADATARVQLAVDCQLGMQVDPRKLPPDVVFVAQAQRAELEVQDFELVRVSKLDGPLVRALSDGVHKLLLEKVAEKRGRLPEKINRELSKNQDKMRLSLADFARQKWQALTKSDTTDAETGSVAIREAR